MRTRDLKIIEARRAEELAARPRNRRAEQSKRGWNPRTIRGEVEGEFRANGAKVFREERP